MKINIITQVKGISPAVSRYVPAFGNTGLHMHTIVYLYQAVIQLVIHPYRILIAAKSGIKRGKSLIEINVENGFAGRIGSGMAGRKKQKAKSPKQKA